MKTCTIICESMTMDDLDEDLKFLHGHVLLPFDPHPATMSAQSLWCMMTPDKLPPAAGNPHEGTSWFEEASSLLSSKFKVRLISNFWPKRYDPRIIDPECADPKGKVVGCDPNCHQWETMREYLKGPCPHEWLIYWPTLGHAKYRIGDENKGIPEHICETTRTWLSLAAILVEEAEAKGFQTILFSDHGSARKDKSRDEQFRNGFVWLPEKIPWHGPRPLTWDTMRFLVETSLCSP